MDAGAPRRGRRLRDAVVDAGWAVREHLVWRPADALRRTADVIKWPFERIAWALRRGLLWRVEDRADALGPMARGIAFGFVIVLAAGAGVAGLLWAAPDRPENTSATVALAIPETTPAPAPTPEPAVPPKPTLQGAAPVFKPTEESSPKAGVSKKAAKGDDSAPASSSDPSSSAADSGEPDPLPSVLSSSGSKPLDATASSARDKGDDKGSVAGPKAIKVAREFAGAFVLYETGRGGPEVRETLTETATPELRNALLRRPPRLPANVKVPKAKVLNVVPGPSRGGVYTVSVSLLRVGLTSELRLDMEPGKGKRWQVTDVLG